MCIKPSVLWNIKHTALNKRRLLIFMLNSRIRNIFDLIVSVMKNRVFFSEIFKTNQLSPNAALK